MTLDDVTAVAWIPLEHVVFAAEQSGVVSLLTVDEVVAGPAEQHVVAVAAQDRVVAGAAVDGDLDERCKVPGGREAVLATVGVEGQVLRRSDVDAERRRVDPVEPNTRAVGGGRELLGAIAAIDLRGVDARAALVEVGVVSGVPYQAVVAGLTERTVVGVAARQGVVVRAAEQPIETSLAEQGVVSGLTRERVIARAAGEYVVAGATEEVRLRQGSVGLVRE